MLKVAIQTDNAAFEDSLFDEVRACFERIVRKLARGESSGRVLDSNGNTVGTFALTED